MMKSFWCFNVNLIRMMVAAVMVLVLMFDHGNQVLLVLQCDTDGDFNADYHNCDDHNADDDGEDGDD